MMNILIIGFGSIAKKHLMALNTLDFAFNIYALRSELNSTPIDGITSIFSLEDIPLKIDFAIISNPTHLHYQYISQLADRAIPLFIEKPPLNSLLNSKELSNKINLLGVKTYVACNLRFHPLLTYLKQFLNLNNIERVNELNVYCGSYLPDWRPNQDFRKTYSANSEMGGGVHLDLFHELDYTNWIFGKPIKTHSNKRSVSSLDINAFDYANYTLNYENFTANIILNYYRRDPKRSIEIVFDNVTWTVNLLLNQIISNDGQLIYEAKNFNILDTYVIQMQYFIEYLSSNEPSLNSLDDSLITLQICLSDE